MNLKYWIVLLTTASLFGASFLFIKIAVAEVDPLVLAALRVVGAAVFMAGILGVSGQRLPRFGRAWGPLIVLGVLTAAIPYFAIAWGQTRIPSSLRGILFATIPIFTLLVVPFVAAETRLGGLKILGVVLAFGGVILAVGPEALVSGEFWGAAMTLLAALSYAMGNIYARLQTGITPLAMATGQLITGSLILVPLAALAGGPITFDFSASVWGSLTAVAVASTAVPVVLMFWLIRNVGATVASYLAFFIPVAAVILGALVLREPLGVTSLLGFGAILLGALLATGTIGTRKNRE